MIEDNVTEVLDTCSTAIVQLLVGVLRPLDGDTQEYVVARLSDEFRFWAVSDALAKEKQHD